VVLNIVDLQVMLASSRVGEIFPEFVVLVFPGQFEFLLIVGFESVKPSPPGAFPFAQALKDILEVSGNVCHFVLGHIKGGPSLVRLDNHPRP
jgi:hypothetical protein